MSAQQTGPPPIANSAPAAAQGVTPAEPLSVELYYWFTNAQPQLKGGASNTNVTNGTGLDYPGHGKHTAAGIISIPAGTGNSLRFSYFQTSGTGNTTAPTDLTLFDTAFSQGDYLATQYKLRNVKISWDFLTYPTPLGDSSFRLRTLWEVQYTTIQTRIDAPFRAVSTDSSGNPISNTAEGTRWFIYPTFGAAVDKKLAKNFRVEAKASGFGIPHHAAIWDAEASAIYQIRHLDLIGAYKGFHFKTSPQSDQYLVDTLSGAYVGVRWNWGLD